MKSYVKFPDAAAVTPYFSGEIPDPFPECKITANSVSIEFGEKAGEIKFKDFEIFKDGQKIQNLHLIITPAFRYFLISDSVSPSFMML